MTLSVLNQQLSNALRVYIMKQKHIRTGNLYRSIMFDCQMVNGELNIQFDSMFYIKYLEYGQFVPDFFNLQTTNQIVTQFVVESVSEVFQNTTP